MKGKPMYSHNRESMDYGKWPKYDEIFHLIVSTTGALNNKVPPERGVTAVGITVSLFAVIVITLIVVACRYV